MKQFYNLVLRHTTLFFKDKGRFLTALMTPIILIVLYITFLGSIYHQSLDSLIQYFHVSKDVIDGFVNGYLFSSLLAVSCVTVSFCSNMIMVQDKAEHKTKDFLIAPVSRTILGMSYFVSTLLITMIINITAFLACLFCLSHFNCLLPLKDILYCLFDIFILTLFGTLLSSIINQFLTTQGQISAVGSIVSAGYGFLCGAYMPISQFSPAIQSVLKFLPGTYGTSLIRTHLLKHSFSQLKHQIPLPIMNEIRTHFDISLTFFHQKMSIGMMYLIMLVSCLALMIIYIIINKVKKI